MADGPWVELDRTPFAIHHGRPEAPGECVGLLGAFRWRRFLTPTERDEIAAALAEACRHTRARIGLCIDDGAAKDPQARADALFREWQLPETERATAVLVYVCAATRRFAIVGGSEVVRRASRSFWEVVDRDLHHHFEEGRYCDGVFKAIAQVALELERLFPPDSGERA